LILGTSLTNPIFVLSFSNTFSSSTLDSYISVYWSPHKPGGGNRTLEEDIAADTREMYIFSDSRRGGYFDGASDIDLEGMVALRLLYGTVFRST
jgi:hypothetical protein